MTETTSTKRTLDEFDSRLRLISIREGNASFDMYRGLEHEDLNKIEAVIEDELNKVKTAGITEQEYQKALNMIRSQFYFGLQTISGKAGQLADYAPVKGAI